MLKVMMNTFKLLMKKKTFLFLAIVIPAILTIFFSFGLGQEGQYRIGVINKDKGIISQSVLKKIENIQGVSIEMVDEETYESKVTGKELELAIIINEDFSENILNNVTDTIEVQSIAESDVKPVIVGVLNSETKNLRDLAKVANGDEIKFKELQKEYESNMPEYNLSTESEKKVSVMMSIGIVIMMILTSGQTILRFVIDDEVNGTKARTILSGVSEKAYSAGVFIVFYICSALTSLVYYGMCLGLGLDFGLDNSLYFLLILLLINLLSVTFYLFVVSFTKDPGVAANMSTIIIIPTSMLSGSFWDFGMMPDYMQKIGNLCPQRWAVNAIETIQNGGTLIDAAPMIIALIMLSLGLFLLSIFFTKRVAEAKA